MVIDKIAVQHKRQDRSVLFGQGMERFMMDCSIAGDWLPFGRDSELSGMARINLVGS